MSLPEAFSDLKDVSFGLYNPKPLLIVLSGPSGVGKDAILARLKGQDTSLHFVVTATTRPPRPSERDGVDYFFLSREQFERMIANGEFIEHARVYQDYKGIPKSQIEAAFASGKDAIVRVDVQGAARLRSLFPEAVLVFIVPDNVPEWLHRLQGRETESSESLHVRLETVRTELAMAHLFDYVIVNAEGKLEQAVATLLHIIDAEHHRLGPRQVDV
jgi:guanylate kinase